jgi:ACS family D-galactonate transporter-like MFS transporter
MSKSAVLSDATTGARPASRLTPELSRLAVLLALSIFINYIDRGNLAIAAPVVKDDLGISFYQLGILFSSFFWTYAIFQIVSGWLVDRFPVNWVLALGILVWSAATIGTGLVRGFTLLLAMRLILGMGESAAYPSYSKIISRHFAESQRGRANSFICAGQASGPAVGTLLGGMLIARVGWRLCFLIFGFASLLWLVPWLKYVRKRRPNSEPDSTVSIGDANIPSAAESRAGATILQILQQPSAWGTFGGLFAYNYVWYFFITWLPTYLVRDRQFSVKTMSVVTSLAFLFLAVSALTSGWLSDKWIAAGASPTRVRKTFTGAGPAIAASILLVGIVANHAAAMAILMLTCVGLGMCTSNLWAVTQTLAGPTTSGKWTGLQNFLGNLAGWIAPAVIGLIVQRTGSFFYVFVITSVVTLLGSVSWIFIVGPIEQIDWGGRNRGSLT